MLTLKTIIEVLIIMRWWLFRTIKIDSYESETSKKALSSLMSGFADFCGYNRQIKQINANRYTLPSTFIHS